MLFTYPDGPKKQLITYAWNHFRLCKTLLMQDFSVLLVVNLWDNMTSAENRRQYTIRVFCKGYFLVALILMGWWFGMLPCSAILRQSFCYTDAVMPTTECCADLENHCRDMYGLWNFHHLTALPRLRKLESERTHTEAIRFLSEYPSARRRLPPYYLLVREVLEAGQTIKALSVAAGWRPKLDGKTRLLRTPYVHALIVGDGKLKLGLNWKLPACWPAFPMPIVAFWAAGRELSPTFLLD